MEDNFGNTQLIDDKEAGKNSLKVTVERGISEKRVYYFTDSFKIGRDEDCAIRLNDGVVSRNHIEVTYSNGKWIVKDLKSSNGTYLNGEKVEKLELNSNTMVELGKNGGPLLLFTFDMQNVNTSRVEPKDPTLTSYIQRYFDESGDEKNFGEHTKMVRQAFQVVKKKQSGKFVKIIAVIGIFAVIAAAYGIYQYFNTKKQKELAENIFYEMKSMEIEFSKLNELVEKSGDEQAIASLNKLQQNRVALEKKYDAFINELDVYKMDEKEKIIYRMARLFGECELKMTPGFSEEVKKYIEKWKTSKRLVNAVQRAETNSYNKIIIKDFIESHLPPQFFYLALQESSFKDQTIGPRTNYGIAKGIWQFIPQTAMQYGLKVGPLLELPNYDIRDERFNFEKATKAAVKYINDIYQTKAQASGLLVIASYNWGQNNIRRIISKMPDNPKERNFWKVLENYRDKIPNETYDYVFYIFSAAVIGENPELFGFNFENPLADAGLKTTNQ